MTYVIGIDVGSQSVKAVLVDDERLRRAITASAPCETDYPRERLGRAGSSTGWQRAIAQSVRELRARGRDRPATR